MVDKTPCKETIHKQREAIHLHGRLLCGTAGGCVLRYQPRDRTVGELRQRELGTNVNLYALVFGEFVLNDAEASKNNPDDEEALRAIDLLNDAALASSGFTEARLALWNLAFPDVELKGLVSEQWKDMGWQGSNLVINFRYVYYKRGDYVPGLKNQQPPLVLDCNDSVPQVPELDKAGDIGD
nr:ELMO domain-containing protein A isoform X3 [Ipomoea trifida]